MKKIVFLLILASLFLRKSQAQAPTEVDGWPYITHNFTLSVGELPKIGLDEGHLHIYFDNKVGEVDKFETNGIFSLGWPIICDGINFSSFPIILDIDHDGKNEMADIGWRSVEGRMRASLYLFDDNATIMQGFPILMNKTSSICAADMDGDNEYEIMVYDYADNLVYCIDRYGNPKPGWPISFELPHYSNSFTAGPAIGDLDFDGKNEYILSTFRYIYAFRFDGAIQQGFPIVLQEDTAYAYWNGSNPPILADVDHDGYLEIITSGDNNNPVTPRSFVVIYEHDGLIKNGWPKYLDDKIIYSPISLSDINNDGLLELGFQMNDSLTYVDTNFNTLPGWPIQPISPDSIIGGAASDLTVLDIDGDGDMEIFFDHNVFYPDSMGQDSLWYYGHSYQFGVDHLGQPLTGFPVRIRGLAWGHPPTFALEPNSNNIYMAIAPTFFVPSVEADTLFVDLFRFPDSTGEPNQWPMVSHDNLMTRNYNFVDNVTSITNDTPPPLPKNVVLKQNYPNPFNSLTTISYSLPKASDVTIDIYDLLGRKLETLVEGKQDAGSHSIIWDASERSSGIYFCRIKTGEISINRKMVLVK